MDTHGELQILPSPIPDFEGSPQISTNVSRPSSHLWLIYIYMSLENAWSQARMKALNVRNSNWTGERIFQPEGAKALSRGTEPNALPDLAARCPRRVRKPSAPEERSQEENMWHREVWQHDL